MAFIRGANVVTDGLVLALDAANPKSYVSGSTIWRDLSGTSVTGSLVNGPTFNSANGGSIRFDGVDDYSQTSTSPITNNSSSLSIECFVQFFNFNNNGFFAIIDAGNLGGIDPVFGRQVGYCLAKNNLNRLYLAIDSGFVDINTIINNNQWYHIVGTANFGTPYSLSLYINGSIITPFSSNTTNSLTISQSNVRISRGYINSGLNVYGAFNLPIIKLYNRALSPTEVLQNYNATKARFGIE